MGSKSLLDRFRDLDGHAKTLDDFRIRTMSGATVTLVSGFVILILLMMEFSAYRSVEMKPSLSVDKSRKEKLSINFNVTFPKLPCHILSLDVIDISGAHQENINHDIYKVRLDPTGQEISKDREYELGDKAKKAKEAFEKTHTDADTPYCGSCYGAEETPEQCCNTCESVREAYLRKSWSFDNPDGIDQCVREGWSERMKSQAHEGCNIHGFIEVNKVAGNFHITSGESFTTGGMHVHNTHNTPYLETIDFTHHVHQLSFGNQVSGIHNPLDGIKQTAPEGSFQYQYFLKVVGTQFKYLNGNRAISNQYSVTEHERSGSRSGPHSPGGLSGIFFNYEISPMLVIYTESRRSFTNFLTNACTIVGGIFTVAGLIDAIIYRTERTLKKKLELGKTN
ncbi:endoplasmic reticulum-golgi intermediate compartment protein 3-like protein [Basidiobolus meristosporus CBS 931.73]|uniref:Endoplasmic reticulum-golgi intermediate compartment protein 3-like protein n=1 Tax=Basidiobolus meristosporus CBS 931.73 TaxID=1314790 RepID=A0A1Y1XG89_9FUNG|nr:endoplasmic reticulum-golgi intermediate compartment protein 3-like protein [Basidiobolus meristosporus CBS 931.73]|eukprot:ORX84778.1 endoplasmic reticulum-golgi intermediate compartment protein 3-like protein [Basidiobolus meristosporus CBS 931.73]